MVKIMGNLGRQLNKLLGKNDFNNVEFKVDELESLQTIQLSKRDLAYAEYFKNVETYIKELYGTEDKFYPFKVGISAVTAASVAPDVLAYLINVRNCGSYYNIIINGKS